MKNILGNTCVSGWVYYYAKWPYYSPFIWHLVLDDEAFLRLCTNYEYYIALDPLFVEEDPVCPRYLNHKSIDPNYPIMELGDVYIHYIHHKSKDKVYDNFCRRRDRSLGLPVVPIVWDKEIKSTSVLKSISELPGSIVITDATSQDEAALMAVSSL